MPDMGEMVPPHHAQNGYGWYGTHRRKTGKWPVGALRVQQQIYKLFLKVGVNIFCSNLTKIPYVLVSYSF